MMNLSIRLFALTAYIPENSIVADVGCDHGHLPVWLVQQGRCRKAFAMDVGKGPLAHAARLVKNCGLEEQIELRLSDGVAALAPGEANVVVIAGMGGALICKILEEGSHMWDSVAHWIISPQSEQGEVRHWLADHGFTIFRENMVLDGGKYYNILDVGRGSMHYETETDYIYGALLIQEKHPVLKGYLSERNRLLSELADNLEKGLSKKESPGGKARLREVRKEMEDIKRIREQIQ